MTCDTLIICDAMLSLSVKIRCQGGQVGYVTDFHPGSQISTPNQDNLSYVTT